MQTVTAMKYTYAFIFVKNYFIAFLGVINDFAEIVAILECSFLDSVDTVSNCYFIKPVTTAESIFTNGGNLVWNGQFSRETRAMLESILSYGSNILTNCNFSQTRTSLEGLHTNNGNLVWNGQFSRETLTMLECTFTYSGNLLPNCNFA